MRNKILEELMAMPFNGDKNKTDLDVLNEFLIGVANSPVGIRRKIVLLKQVFDDFTSYSFNNPDYGATPGISEEDAIKIHLEDLTELLKLTKDI